MKNKGKYKYLLLVIGVAIVGFLVDLYTSSVPINFGSVQVLDEHGQTQSHSVINYPYWLKISNLLTNFLYGLAAAIFITVFIASRLQDNQAKEQEAKLSKLFDDININVFDTLFKTIIPEEIFKVIKSEIIENRVIRRDAKWVYDFTLDEDSGDIHCRMTTRYELHNLSRSQVLNPVELDLDPLGGSEYKIIEAECEDMNGKQLVNYDPQSPEKSTNVEVESNNGKTKVKYAVEIPKESYVIYKTVFHRIYQGDVVDSQATKVPVIGADIIVNFPNFYKFDISPMMSSVPKLISESDIQKIYKIDGGILPWQGFAFYLTKMRKKSN